ncbi:hypothetical protein BAQU_0557 [Bifidobacterium aquikefiri]|uniref:Uncharacterized protein n=1 Tax=Bifidobacterium aquikefiri TaxID=1653207 RepID=A0A261G913_9BIFI|nr:hypothetical protein BAQU_0557 [Bifidobacterium aquikefiri]
MDSRNDGFSSYMFLLADIGTCGLPYEQHR